MVGALYSGIAGEKSAERRRGVAVMTGLRSVATVVIVAFVHFVTEDITTDSTDTGTGPSGALISADQGSHEPSIHGTADGADTSVGWAVGPVGEATGQ